MFISCNIYTSVGMLILSNAHLLQVLMLQMMVRKFFWPGRHGTC